MRSLERVHRVIVSSSINSRGDLPAQSFLDQRLGVLNRQFLEGVAGGNYYYQAELSGEEGAWVTVSGRRLLMHCSYSYLGLNGHPTINQASQQAITDHGTGTRGVRLLAGTIKPHRELERAISRFLQTEDAIVFSSGYVANVATISALVGKEDVVICDRLNHASIFDGCAMSGAKLMTYRHNDMDALQRRLEQAGDRGKLVVVDAVFSMDGDIANLPGIVALTRRFGAILMVDEAHSLGVLGTSGRGITEYYSFGPEDIDVRMGTLSKAIPSIGGYVAGSTSLVDALKHNARAFIFSGALPPPQVAAATAALEVIQHEPEHLLRLRRNSERYGRAVREAGFNVLNSTTPIVPIICPNESVAFEMTRQCQAAGLFVLPIVYPAVPAGLPRLRTTVTARHSDEDIDFAVDILRKVARDCGVIA